MSATTGEMFVGDEGSRTDALSSNQSGPVEESFCNSYINNLTEDINSYSNNLTTDVDFDVDVYLACFLGPKLQPYKFLIPITVVYCFMFVTGIVGNVLVCYVILKNPSMRTSTNVFLCSLSMADVTLLFLGLPNDLHVYWQQYPWIFGEPLCKIRALVSEMTSYSSVLTIVAFSMERYLAICHPLYSYTMSGLRRASKIIAALWFFAFATAIPYAVFTKVNYVQNPFTNETLPESAYCGILYTPPFLFESSSLLFFIVPMTIMVFLYVRMGLKIRQAASFAKNTNVHGESKQAQAKKAILKMLAAVVVAFFICWAPFHAQRLLYVMFYRYEWKFVSEGTYQVINEKLFYITGCFYYFSSTVNPILYNVMSVKYRNAFKETLCGKREDAASAAMMASHTTNADHMARSYHGTTSIYSRHNSNPGGGGGRSPGPAYFSRSSTSTATRNGVSSIATRADVEYSVQLSSFKSKRAAAAASSSSPTTAEAAATTVVVDMAEWNGSVVTIETGPTKRRSDHSKPAERREKDAATSLRLGENSILISDSDEENNGQRKTLPLSKNGGSSSTSSDHAKPLLKQNGSAAKEGPALAPSNGAF